MRARHVLHTIGEILVAGAPISIVGLPRRFIFRNMEIVRRLKGKYMKLGSAVRRSVLIGTILLLLALAWALISGGLNQISRSQAIGQAIETIVQIACGLLSLLIVINCFYWQKLRRSIRLVWLISFIMTAGISSVVWGPPMLIVGVIFAALAFLVARAIIWLLQVGGA